MRTAPRCDDQPRRPAALFSVLRFISVLLLAGAIALGGHPRMARAGVNMWTSSGPDGTVNALAVDSVVPGTLYAGTAGKGVFKSVDEGTSWMEANQGLGEIYVESLVIAHHRSPGSFAHPAGGGCLAPADTLFAASPNHGVFKSTDGAATWMDVNAGLPSPSAQMLAYDPASATLYASTNDGVFKRMDDDSGWEPTGLLISRDPVAPNEAAFNAWIDCLAFDPSTATLYACFFTWSGRPGPSWTLLKSTDAGATWNTLALPYAGGPYEIAIDATPPATIYVATYDPQTPTYDVLRSTDSGMTWDRVDGAMLGCDADCSINALAVGSAPPRSLYAATARGVYRTMDGSESWEPLNTGLGGRAVLSLALDSADPGHAYAGTLRGVFSMQQAPRCGGDCDGDRTVGVAELVTIVDIVLGTETMDGCVAGDIDGDGHVAISDLVAAVDNALLGCPEFDGSQR